MKIGNFDLNKKVLVVAEIGNNHEGNFEVAKKLVCKAAECGVDAVKFQTFKTENYVSKSNAEKFEKLKSFELSYSQFERLSHLAKSLGLLFISTPLDLESAKFLERIVDAYKISSGDNTFYPLIKTVAQTNKPLMISSGLTNLEEIYKAILTVKEKRGNVCNLAILHCVCAYPVPIEEVNLNSIKYLKDNLNLTIGYSDHTLGIDASVLSVALGSKIVEKHFTLDHNYSAFRDHQLSANPTEMKELVEKIRYTELMLGDYDKKIQSCEREICDLVRRSIVVNKDLKKGTILKLEDLTWVRPGKGIAPGKEKEVIGKKLKKNLRFGQIIKRDELE